jgi:hypothetical protein
MKPEPLKDKVAGNITWAIKKDDKALDYDVLYRGKDIASAVEWLKDKMFRHLIDGSMETRDNISTYDAYELIDEAFEDVIQNEKETETKSDD